MFVERRNHFLSISRMMLFTLQEQYVHVVVAIVVYVRNSDTFVSLLGSVK